ncbi:hypothetical protein M413DRAFT_322039 [Hebeloma cylindrosporum]|uniref:Uncharacterized protein n=1 Tax=Hebeloma cylindrosporum TaxID=76867 RepID=A0A0C2Y4Y9_HEBCY|nr:hypothetical protein M413DRAFT_322039 [Hebeloma cylindrosporum h7]
MTRKPIFTSSQAQNVPFQACSNRMRKQGRGLQESGYHSNIHGPPTLSQIGGQVAVSSFHSQPCRTRSNFMHPVSWHRHPQMSAAAKRRLDSGHFGTLWETLPYRKHRRVQCCGIHPLFGKVDEERRLDRLEFAWNMQRLTLNVDTRLIVIRHWKCWVLLPQTSVINIYRHYNAIGKRFPAVDVKKSSNILSLRPRIWFASDSSPKVHSNQLR